MSYRHYDGEQTKTAINAVQLFEALEEHRRHAVSAEGSMHWKTINGKAYLYRVYPGGRYRSLGPEGDKTRDAKARFEAAKAAHREREARLTEQLRRHAGYVRANHLHRFPATGARVIRALQRQRVPFRVIGTNALYAYEARAGVLIQPEHLATDDMDVLMDARQGLRIVAQLKRRTLLSVLKASDKTFRRVSTSPMEFCAANDSGYRVDFVTQGDSPMQPNDFERLLEEDDLTPVTIESLKWLTSAPRFEAVVFDSRGMPLRVPTVDPRAFILHKWYASRRSDRERMKRARDEDQARLMATLLAHELTGLTTTRAVSRVFPHTLRQAAADELDDLDV